MIINQICNAWEHEYLPISLSLALIRFRLFALPNDPKINHNTSSSKGQNDDGNETLSALPHVGKRGRQLGVGGSSKGNVDINVEGGGAEDVLWVSAESEKYFYAR